MKLGAIVGMSGRPEEYIRRARELEAYLDGKRDEAAAIVPQELVDAMSLVGDADFVKDRIAAYREAGVTVLNVERIGPNGVGDVQTLAEWLA